MAEESSGPIAGVIHEWKTAKPGEKVIIGGAVIGVAGIAIYFYMKNKGTTPTTQVNAPGQGTDTSGQQQLGFPTIPSGSVPVLPAGINPIYDANGNVLGYGPGTYTQPTSSSTTTTGTDTGTQTGTTDTGTTSGSSSPSTGMHGSKPSPKPVVHKVAKKQSTHVAQVYARHAPAPAPAPKKCPPGYSGTYPNCRIISPTKLTPAQKKKIATAERKGNEM